MCEYGSTTCVSVPGSISYDFQTGRNFRGYIILHQTGRKFIMCVVPRPDFVESVRSLARRSALCARDPGRAHRRQRQAGDVLELLLAHDGSGS